MSQLPIGDFPSNAHNKPPSSDRPKQQKIIRGKVVERKPPLSSKLKDLFTGEDLLTAGGHVISDVVVPAIRNTLYDALVTGGQRMLFGDVVRPPNSPNRGMPVNYNSFYNGISPAKTNFKPPGAAPAISNKARANHDFREIVLQNKSDADAAIVQLEELIEAYQFATVADLYDIIGIHENYTDRGWGWNDLRTAGVQRVREGYLLSLPKPIPVGE